MKQFMLFYLLLLPFCSRAQLTETFDGPALDSRNPWRVDSAGFYLSGGALCFDASGRDKGIHYIKTEIDYHHTMMHKEYIFTAPALTVLHLLIYNAVYLVILCTVENKLVVVRV